MNNTDNKDVKKSEVKPAIIDEKKAEAEKVDNYGNPLVQGNPFEEITNPNHPDYDGRFDPHAGNPTNPPRYNTTSPETETIDAILEYQEETGPKVTLVWNEFMNLSPADHVKKTKKVDEKDEHKVEHEAKHKANVKYDNAIKHAEEIRKTGDVKHADTLKHEAEVTHATELKAADVKKAAEKQEAPKHPWKADEK